MYLCKSTTSIFCYMITINYIVITNMILKNKMNQNNLI